MGETRQLALSANRYFLDHDVFSDKPYSHYSVNIEIDIEDHIFEITYIKEKDELTSKHKTRNYLYLDLKEEELTQLLDFITKDKPKEDGRDAYIEIGVHEGVLRNRRTVSGLHDRDTLNEYSIDVVRVYAKWDSIIIETFEGSNPMIPYYETEHGNEPQDRDNLGTLQEFSGSILNDLDPEEDRPVKLEPISENIKRRLQEAKWGEEVIHHIKDGDECLELGLLHPALNSYIHAIEWTIIAYLEDQEDSDIIQDEKDGTPYYFAGRNPNLINELTKHEDIDQKTESKLRSINSAERRWIAHHKSGDATQTEIEAIRSRLDILLRQLFGS